MTPPSLSARYKMTTALAEGVRDANLLHGPVRAQWTADARYAWYTTRAAEGLQHLLVDVARCEKRRLVQGDDLLRAATAHGAKVGKAAELRPTHLRVVASTGDVEFAAGALRWRVQGSGQLQCIGPFFEAHELPSPDGSAALSLNGPNLRLRTLASMDHAVSLTEDGESGWGFGDFAEFLHQVDEKLQGKPLRPHALWSPDSAQFAVMRVDRRRVRLNHLVQSVPTEGVRPQLHSYPYPMPGDAELAPTELWFISRDGRRVRARVEGLQVGSFTHLAEGLGRWAPDGVHFDLVDVSRDSTRTRLWRIDTRDGSARLLLEETAERLLLPAPGIMERPMFHVLADGRVIWWSQRSGWGHLYIVSADGSMRAITSGAWLVRSLLHVDEAGSGILIAGSGRESGDPYYCYAYRVDLEGGEPRLLTPEPEHHDLTQYGVVADDSSWVAPDGSCFIDNHSTITTLPRSWLRAADGRVLMALELAETPECRPEALPQPEPFTMEALDAAALDGAGQLWGVLYKPLAFDPTECYPIVELIYGAPQTAVVPKAWGAGAMVSVAEQLATLGFVVVILDGPGTPFRSHAFQLASHGRIESCGGLPDHAHAIATLARTRPWMDLSRVGIVGGSGGGYATVRAMGTLPDFYKVGVSLCGNHDQAAYIAGWGDRFQGLYSTERYATQANTTVAAAIVGDLLLVHGDMDNNVHPGMTLQVVDALIKADRNFDLLIVPNAGHMLMCVPYVQRRVFDYFVSRLMGAVPPRPGGE